MAAKAAKKAAFVKTGKVSFVADAGGDAEEGDSDDGAEGADAIDLDLSGGVSLRSKRSEFDLLSGGNMSQAELVRRAFSSQGLDADGNGHDDGDASGAAGPGVENEEQEFERLKREMMEEDLPKEETPVTGLPGWGAWGGLGASNFKSPAQLKKEAAEKARREARRAAANSSRADAKLKHVILNEKVDAKAMKYQVTTLPYPFTSLDQYERSLATPVGREWNTTSSFQQNVKPKFITKAGEIIEPAKFNPKVGQGAKEKAGKKNKAAGEAGQKRKR
jgi:U3 small nucleolar RNA-associated protein 14